MEKKGVKNYERIGRLAVYGQTRMSVARNEGKDLSWFV
jgi:hypothetical protein